MSDDRDESGQFTPSTEGLVGREHELVQAGWKPMPDPERKQPEEALTVKEAAALLAPEQEPAAEAIIYYDRATGEPTDPKEAITVEQGARDLSQWWESKGALDAKSIATDLA